MDDSMLDPAAGPENKCYDCDQGFTPDGKIIHDLTVHDRLEYARMSHRQYCDADGWCHCRIDDYERINARLKDEPEPVETEAAYQRLAGIISKGLSAGKESTQIASETLSEMNFTPGNWIRLRSRTNVLLREAGVERSPELNDSYNTVFRMLQAGAQKGG